MLWVENNNIWYNIDLIELNRAEKNKTETKLVLAVVSLFGVHCV